VTVAVVTVAVVTVAVVTVAGAATGAGDSTVTAGAVCSARKAAVRLYFAAAAARTGSYAAE
jgi:hypothetical protein